MQSMFGFRNRSYLGRMHWEASWRRARFSMRKSHQAVDFPLQPKGIAFKIMSIILYLFYATRVHTCHKNVNHAFHV
jgi:hypothetical protein